RITKSKTALKNSLLQLMNNKDFKAITITDIVQQAHLNRGTFYKHYQFKEELLDEVDDDVIKDLVASYLDPYEQTETFVLNDLTASAIEIFHHVEKYANFYILVVNTSIYARFHI